MAIVYKFKVSFEDYEDISRVIEIKATQTFLDFHKAILDSIKFDDKQMASFYMSNDSWKKGQEITLEDMSEGDEKRIPIMANSKLNQFVADPHQKILYVYDFIECWAMNIELVSIQKEETPKTNYPVCIKSTGLAPKQYDKVQKFGMVEDNEFDEITKNYLNHSDEVPGDISDEDGGDGFGLLDSGEEGGEAEASEFGFED
ncbi:MAG: plasmid pRiA4b ORF-3 family protein [Bacteroidia bacterium]|nr:plasmid pRiA4b ORF-3 family protein [Bacteroidia bacterium]MCF8445730.1 plasmid pRiA4b ORF-3 family protein [Bacteroidia bacterium]